MTKQIICENCGESVTVSKYARLNLCGPCKVARRNKTFREYYNDPNSGYYVPRKKTRISKMETAMSLDEVSAVFGVSKERIRQIEARAMDKLRINHPELEEWVKI